VAETKARPLSVRDLTDAGSLAEKRKELENARQNDKIDWSLNEEFYKNNQWAFWNKQWPGGGRLETPMTDQGDRAHYKVRLTVADIRGGVQHYIAQLTKNRPIITATPNTGSDRDLKAAQVATALYEYWWGPDALSLDTKLQSALTHATISQGYWHINWDKFASKMMTYMVSPDGQPLVGPQWSDENIDIYRDELQKSGVDPKQMERTVALGELSIKVLPGKNVLLDPGAATFEDAQYAFVIVNMSVDDLIARWPRDKKGNSTRELKPDAVPGEESLNVPGASLADERPKSIRRVYYGYFRKTPAMPKGRHVVWTEGPDMILEDTAWPFPFDDLPLVKFPGLEKPNSPLDIPIVTASRPIAKHMNRSVSQVVEHQNLTLKPQVLAPTGSLAERLTTEPGRTIFFNPINGAIPQWREIPGLPSYVFEQIADMERRLDRLFNRMPTQRDALPARIDSSGSIDLIHEAVADQLSPVIRRMENALVRAGMLMVKLAQKYYIEERTLKIIGSNGAVQVRKFMNSDLEGGFSFRAETGSGLPRTRAGKQARIEFMLTNRLIDERAAMKYLDTADMTGLTAKWQAAEEQAYRTIEKIKKGQPLNPVALQAAMAQAQAAMADDTADIDGDGQPDDPQHKQAALQQAIEQAAISPMPFEDPQVHLEVLTVFMDSIEFEALDPQLQSRFIQRFQAMLQAAQQLAQQPPLERPRVTLQLKGTTSAPVAGEILRESGVKVSDEAVAEPPLETWVTDSIDKPDMDSAGNDPLTQEEQMQSMQQTEQTHALKMAKAAHEVSLASSKADAAATPDHSDARAEELHQQKMRHAEEAHQAKLAQAGNRGG
jgi:hypothetical protein